VHLRVREGHPGSRSRGSGICARPAHRSVTR
jgi:hypothetical protein